VENTEHSAEDEASAEDRNFGLAPNLLLIAKDYWAFNSIQTFLDSLHVKITIEVQLFQL